MKVVFLDRDGTLIVDPPDLRVNSVAEIKLFPDTIAAMQYLAKHGFAVIFITNQAGIGEGVLTEESFWQIQEEVVRRLAPSGVTVLKTYMNSEVNSPNASQWRKPGPKMLLQAAEDFGIDLQNTFMIGDRDSDVQAAINAGCKGGVLVQTATGRKVQSSDAVYTAPHLMDAVRYVVANG